MPNHLQVDIRCGVRRLRGESQAYLIQGDDDHFYVAKFAGNPKGKDPLVSEWMAYRLLERLGVSMPRICLLYLPPEVQRKEQFHFIHGRQALPVSGALHLGCSLPCNPQERSIWDFLPHKFLVNVTNLADFATVLVFDIWLQKKTRRQAIFARTDHPSLFQAYMIDHSSGTLMAERVTNPDFRDKTVQFSGTYLDENLYGLLTMKSLCEKAVRLIEGLSDLHVSAEDIPEAWFGDETAPEIEFVLSVLDQRRAMIAEEVAQALKSLSTGR